MNECVSVKVMDLSTVAFVNLGGFIGSYHEMAHGRMIPSEQVIYMP